MIRKLWILGLAGLSLSMLGAECIDPLIPNKPRVAALRGFSSGEELRSFLAGQATSQHRAYNGGFPFFFMGGASPAVDLASGPSAGAAENDSSSAGDGYSTTNIQEFGVDESDIIKNDGEMIYMLTDDKIRVVRAAPVEGLTELTPLEIDSHGHSLYLRDKTLVALSQQWQYYYYDDAWALPGSPTVMQAAEMVGAPWNDGAQTTVTLFDVTDPASATVKATLRFEGNLASSRLIDGKLHLVLTTTPRLPDDNPTPLAIGGMTLAEWIPDFEKELPDGTVDSGDIVGWDSFFRPEDPDGYGMTVVVTLDVDDPEADFASTAVAADAGTVYASTDSLYLTDTAYATNGFTYRTDTIIHKLRFVETGTEYVASGIVPGRPLNQYSLGEHEDFLRIATTVDDFSFNSSGPTNAVYVLGENGVDLDIAGKVENIAPGETIYAARFLGDRGFLVTFRRVDPLFTMDLSNPFGPKVVGELKVPGYSDHIQLMDEDHLLTIGKDAQDAGDFAWIQGVQLSIFDISDMANPKLLAIDGTPAKEIIGGRGTNSEANYNPKAFNYFRAAELLAFPVDVYEKPSSGQQGWAWGQHEFTGLYVYRVTTERGFEFLGRIESGPGETNGCFWGYYGTTRGVFIDNVVYSVTERDVKAASVDDVGTIIGQVQFSGAEPLVYDCFWAEPDIILPGGVGLR